MPIFSPGNVSYFHHKVTSTLTLTRRYLSLLSRNNVNFRGGPIAMDVPDIRFRFRLAGYPAIFGYPVPAKILAVARYCSRIIYLFNGANSQSH